MSLSHFRPLLLTAIALPLAALAGGCAAKPKSDPEGSFLHVEGEVTDANTTPIFVWTRDARPFDGAQPAQYGGAESNEDGEVIFLVGTPSAPGPQRDLSEGGAYAAEPRISTGYFVGDLSTRCDGLSCTWTAAAADPSLVVVHLDREAAEGTCAARRLGGPKARGLHLMRAIPVSIDDARTAEETCARRATDAAERRLCSCEHAGDTLVEVELDTRFRIQPGAAWRTDPSNGLRTAAVMR